MADKNDLKMKNNEEQKETEQKDEEQEDTEKEQKSPTDNDGGESIKTSSTQDSGPGVTEETQPLRKVQFVDKIEVEEFSARSISNWLLPFGKKKRSNRERSESPGRSEHKSHRFARIRGDSSTRRGEITHSRSRKKADKKEERRKRKEKHFFEKIEMHRDRRLERICICPVTKWLLFKERMERVGNCCSHTAHASWMLCCPPLCFLISRIAFWPPKREYFFFEDHANIPTVVTGETEGPAEAKLLARRKKQIKKIKKVNKKCLHKKFKLGMSHPCANDIDGLEGFVLKTERSNYIGCVRIPSPTPPLYSILYSHPNASDMSDHLIGVPNLFDMASFYKCDIYTYDYSGYGISSGYPSEQNQNSDIKAVYDYMRITKKIPASKIVLLGYSIGTAASVHLISTIGSSPAGVILEAPPSSILRALLWRHNRQHAPSDTCCADRFVTYDKILKVRIPVLVIHGEDDTIIPIEHGKIICERAVNRVSPLWVRAAHDNLENCKEVWLRIRKFLTEEIGIDRLKKKKSIEKTGRSKEHQD